MKKIFLSILLSFGLISAAYAEMEMFELAETCAPINMGMISCEVIEDVSTDDAIESMKLRANMLNFKLVGHMPLSEQVKANGGNSERMEIFQFCDANIAAQMVAQNRAFAGYLPCRISVVEDKGKTYLITLNMDATMQDATLPRSLQATGLLVRNNIYSIISAGAEGDL